MTSTPDRAVLPPAARRWLDAALGPDHAATAPAAPVVLQVSGTIRRTPLSDRMTWEGRQTFDPSGIGFHWQARLRVARVLWVDAEDRLDQDGGRGGAKLFGLLPVGGASGADATRSQLVRNLAELAFVPGLATAAGGLVWSADGNSAFTLAAPAVDPGALVRFTVDADGDITLARSTDRPRENGRSGFLHEPYRLAFTGHEALASGIRIPRHATGTFETSAGDWTYWQFDVIDVVSG